MTIHECILAMDPAAVGVEVGTYVYESDLTKAAVTPVPPPAADPGK